MGDWNGTVPTILAGDVPTGDQWQAITDEAFALSGPWTTWAPTLTNLTLGSGGTLTARYRRLGKGDFALRFKFIFGAGSAVGTDPQFTLPSGILLSSAYAAADLVGVASLTDSGTAVRRGGVDLLGSGTLRLVQFSSEVVTSITSTSPWTWTTSDVLACNLSGLELA